MGAMLEPISNRSYKTANVAEFAFAGVAPLPLESAAEKLRNHTHLIDHGSPANMS